VRRSPVTCSTLKKEAVSLLSERTQREVQTTACSPRTAPSAMDNLPEPKGMDKLAKIARLTEGGVSGVRGLSNVTPSAGKDLKHGQECATIHLLCSEDKDAKEEKIKPELAQKRNIVLEK